MVDYFCGFLVLIFKDELDNPYITVHVHVHVQPCMYAVGISRYSYKVHMVKFWRLHDLLKHK